MSTKANDTFTETIDLDISLHTPSPTGTSWTPSTALDTTVIAATDKVQHATVASERTAREGTDIGADIMDVSADIQLNTNNSGHRSGVAGRYSGSAHDSQYQAYGQGNSSTVRDIFLYKNIAGTRTQLGTYAATTAANTDVNTLKLQIRTAAKKVFVDGTERISSADDNLTGNQYAGIYGRNSLPRLDNYLSEDVPSGTVNVDMWFQRTSIPVKEPIEMVAY